MEFSATGKLLDPYYKTVITVEKENEKAPEVRTTTTSIGIVSHLDYIPGVSTIIGIGRVLLGIVHSIVHLVSAIFTDKEFHLSQARRGVWHILGGIIEAIPIAGNLTAFFVRRNNIKILENQANEKIDKNLKDYENMAIMFDHGEIVGRMHLESYKGTIPLYGGDLSFEKFKYFMIKPEPAPT